MRAHRWVLLCLLPAGCAHQAGSSESPGAAPVAADPSACPTAIPGSAVREEDTPGGAALVFTAPERHVDELRRRVAHLVAVHTARREAYRRATPGRLGPVAGAAAGRDLLGPLLRARARAEHARLGARVYFDASRPAEIEHVRRIVNGGAEEMQGASCPLLDLRLVDVQPARAGLDPALPSAQPGR